MNKNRLILSLEVFCFVFHSFQERAKKHDLSSTLNTTSEVKSYSIFYLKCKLNQVSAIALPDW